MAKKFVRVDIEYNDDDILNPGMTRSWIVLDNVKRAIKEDMPYVKVIASRTCDEKDELDNNLHVI